MSIKIGSNIDALGAVNQLNKVSASAASVMQRLSSGLRINKACDDAAGLAISSSLEVSSRVYTQAIRNINDGASSLSIADGALQQLTTILQRQKELATEAANGTYSSNQRTALQAESTQLTAEYNRIIATTVFNGTALLNGDTTQMQLQVGPSSQNSSRIAVDLSGLVTTATGTSAGSSVTTASSGIAEQDSFDFGGLMRHESATFFAPNGYSFVDSDYLQFQTMENGVAQNYYVWFNVYGSAVDPGISQGALGSGIELHIQSGDSENDIAGAIVGAINSLGSSRVTASNTSNEVTITNAEAGNAADTVLWQSMAMYSGMNTTQGSGPIPGDYFTFSSPSQDYYVYYNYSGNGNPTVVGRQPIMVSYDPTWSSATLLAATVAAIQSAAPEVTASSAGSSFATGLRISSSSPGTVSAPSTSGMSSSMSVTRDVVGTASAINLSSNAITVASHGYTTAQAITLATSGGLPGGLSTSTTYYAIITDGNTIKLATSVANANAGTAIDISSYGTGTMTLTGVTAVPTTSLSPYLNNLDLSSQSAARGSLDTVDTQMQRVATAIGSVGAAQSRLATALNQATAIRDNQVQAVSRIMDADVGHESAEYLRLSIIQQAASAILAQANQVPALALKLLK